MKDLDYNSNILSGTNYLVSPEGASLMNETNSLDKQVGRSPLSVTVIIFDHGQDS
jgi:hypothetical protein